MLHTLENHFARDLGRIAGNAGERPLQAPHLLPGERRDVAVLFLDISGFTALAEKLDFELVHLLVNGIMQAFSGIVAAGGGYVDKLEGDRIMALFGAGQAGDNDAIRAVDCAIRMLEALGKVNDILSAEGIEVGARAGVSCGQVIVAPDACGHLTATGDVVNVASRLEAVANPGCVIVSSSARDRCGEFYLWKDLGEISIRGRTAPVHAFEPAGPGKIPVQRWERAARISGTPLLGREREMALLWSAWAGVSEGSFGVVSIMGEAGIGKSRLLHEFVSELRREVSPPRVLTGRNLSFSQPPLGLWTTLMEDAASVFASGDGVSGQPGPSSSEAAVAEKLPFLRSLFSLDPEDTSLKEMNEDSRRREMMIGLRNLIVSASSNRDLVLVLEDLHWMDAASHEILEFLLAGLKSRKRVLFLLSSRTEGARELHASAIKTFIELGALGEADGRLIIRHMLDGCADASIENLVLARSGGNPFFIEELILDLVEGGLLVETPGGWVATGDQAEARIPESLGGILRARIDRLLPELKTSILIASVLGAEFSEGLFMKVAGMTGGAGGAYDGCLRELCRRGFLSEAGSRHEPVWRFSHILIRDASYEMLLHRNRTLLHRYAAEALEGDPECAGGDMAGVLSNHWSLAGNIGKAIEWGLRALSHCDANYLNEEGLAVADRLTEWIGTQPGSSYRDNSLFEVMMMREKFLGLLARREEQAGQLRELATVAERSGRPDWKVMAKARLGRMQIFTGKLDQARETLEPVLNESAGMTDRAVHGGILTDMAALCIKQDRPKESLPLLEEALGIFRNIGDRNSECLVINSLGIAHWNMDDMPEALSCFRAANELSRETRNRWYEGNTLLNMGVIHRCLGEIDRARELYLLALELNRETGNMQSEANAHANLGILALLDGRLSDAGEHYEEALSIYRRTGNRLLEMQTLSKLGRLFTRVQRHAEAEDCLRKSLLLQQEIGQTRDRGETLNSLAELLLLTDRFEEARPLLELALEQCRGCGDSPGEINALCMLAETALLRGDHAAAVSFRERVRALEPGIGEGDESLQKLQRLDGLLGGADSRIPEMQNPL